MMLCSPVNTAIVPILIVALCLISSANIVPWAKTSNVSVEALQVSSTSIQPSLPRNCGQEHPPRQRSSMFCGLEQERREQMRIAGRKVVQRLRPFSQSRLYSDAHNSRDNKAILSDLLDRMNNADKSTIRNSRRSFVGKCSTFLGGVTAGMIVGGFDAAKAASGPMTYPGGNQIKSLRSMGGLPKKIRSICLIMDELQRDLMQERFDLVEAYPAQLRSYVPVFTAYTDTAFSGDEPAYKGLRVALRYEVGRFFAAVERLKSAVSRRDLDASYVAYSDMALHFDRYLNVGNLYTYRDDIIDREKFYKGIDDAALVYADPKKDPALVRDLILLTSGPDKGRSGIVIGIYPDGSNNCVVKLDRYKSTSGIREIRVVPRQWAAKRLGEQDPDDVFLIPRKGEKA